jgi:hypothetical protein
LVAAIKLANSTSLYILPALNGHPLHTLAYAIPDDEIVPLLIIVVLLLFGIRGLAWNYLKRLRARSWMTNHGRIELVSVEVRDVRHFRYYIARLDYSYSVNGEYYSGYQGDIIFS